MEIINLTPHTVNLHRADGSVLTLAPSAPAPRLATIRRTIALIDGLEVVHTRLGEPEGVPDPREGTIFIVSALVAEHPAVANRTDLAYPGMAVRDDAGRVVGAQGICAGPGLARKLRAEAAKS